MHLCWHTYLDVHDQNKHSLSLYIVIVIISCCAVRASWAPVHTAYVKGLHSFLKEYMWHATFVRDNFKFEVSLASLLGPLLRIISTVLCNQADTKTQQLVHAVRFYSETESLYRRIVQSNLKCLIQNDINKLLFYPKIPVASSECLAWKLWIVLLLHIKERVFQPSWFYLFIDIILPALGYHHYNFYVNSLFWLNKLKNWNDVEISTAKPVCRHSGLF